MILKKKNLIKQVKNFTLNFGPQHPAAHVRRYVQITRYEYLILLFLYKLFRIYNNKVNYYLDNTQAINIVYLGSNHKQFWCFVLFTGILLVWLTKMNSFFKNVIFKNNIQIFLVYIKTLCMSIIFFFNTNDALQRKPTTFKVLLFKSTTFVDLIKHGDFLKSWEIYFLIFFNVKIFEKANVLSNIKNIIIHINIQYIKIMNIILVTFFSVNSYTPWKKLFLILLNSILPFKFIRLFFSFCKFLN